MTSIPSPVRAPARNAQKVPEVSTSSRPTIIPWGAYYVVYFVQAVIMSMILTNVPVFLRQGLVLDWLALTASFAVIVVPVILRPLFAWITDRRPASLSTLLVSGMALVIAGSAGASVGSIMSIEGFVILTISFAIAVVGATLMNVAADSHIVRAVPLDQSARVNSRKRVFAFLGIMLGQGCYLLLVGTHFTDLGRWTIYFTVPAVVALVTWVVFSLKHGWHILPNVEGLPPVHAPWLIQAQADAIEKQHKIPSQIFFMLIIIAFLLMVPDGLIEATFENFIVDTYGGSSWMLYGSIMAVGTIPSVIGYIFAGHSNKRPPEWDLLWYIPLIAIFDGLLWVGIPFLAILVMVVGLQAPIAFILVRLLQLWQEHSYSRRPALTFQIYMATYQLGKLVGIGISGFVMVSSGYTGLFAGAVITWGILMGSVLFYHVLSRKISGARSESISPASVAPP